MQPLFLKIFHKGNLVKVQPLTDDQISIGSSEGLTVQLEGLSSWHVLIEKKLDRFVIFDLGSEEGTYVNGEKLTGEMEVTSGTKISLGEYEVHFFIGTDQLQEEDLPAAAKSSSKKSKIPAKPKSAASEVPTMSKAVRPNKPKKKGYWNTYAPESQIKNLDDHFEPSVGNLIEVMVAWKERVLFSKYLYQNGDFYIGSSEDCQVRIPNMLGNDKYKFLTIAGGAKVYIGEGVKAYSIKGKEKSTREVEAIISSSSIPIKPYETVKLNFNEVIQLYIRTVPKQKKTPFVGLLNFTFSETVSFVLATFLTALLLFYVAFYAPNFLIQKDEFLEKNIITAKVVFQKRNEVQQYKLSDKNRAAKTTTKKKNPITTSVKRPRPKKPAKKASIPSIKKLTPGQKSAQSARRSSKKGPRKEGSLRPGGSIKTGKSGSTAPTKAPDPTKVGLLGVYGGGGALNKLDQGATGQGGLVGLAKESTGYAGTEESYSGTGVGTKTKEVGSGGQGSSLIGLSGIKTQGRGTGTSGKGLGSRGEMDISFDEGDVEGIGEIDRAGILRKIRENKTRFDSCYQFALQQQPSAQGSLKMQWDIQGNGSVRLARAIDDKVGSKQLSNCVAGVLSSIRFPAPPAGQVARVAFSFVFST